MGNMCCCQEENKPRAPRPPVRTRASSVHFKIKSEDALLQGQKQLLHDFGPAMQYLQKHGTQNTSNSFTGFYVHQKIANDEVSEYFKGTLVDENGIQFECIVKKIDKVKVTSTTQKKNLAIQYLVTRYTSYPFIINCLHFHQNQQYLFLLFDLRSYEHLNAYDKNSSKPAFSNFFYQKLQTHIRFVLAGIILGLQKLHLMRIVYRGVNTENIVIMDNGYPLLTNLSKLHPEGNGDAAPAANHFTSPEQFRGQAVTRATDCWALGVLIYYLCKGTFINYSTFRQRQFRVEGVSSALIDLVNQLLLFKPEERLGYRGVSAIKNHQFFDSFQWQQYQQMSLESPLSIQKTNLQKQVVSQQYNQQNNYTALGDPSFSMMGLMLFMDFATVQLISDSAQKQAKEAEDQPDCPSPEPQDEYQFATQIDISGDYD